MRLTKILSPFILGAIIFTSRASSAPLRSGDILVNHLFGPSIQQYRPDGTLVGAFHATGLWEGAGITPDGRIVSTFRGPQSGFGEWRAGGLTFFGPDGSTQTVLTPEVNLAGDVSVFHDGALAVSSQWGSSIEVYTTTGAHLRSIVHPAFAGDKSPFGTAVAPDDTFWTASARSPTINHFSKSGVFLGSFEAAFNVGEVAIDPVDGTLWLPDENSNRLYNYTPTGAMLTSFATAVPIEDQTFHGIAVGPQRTLYVASTNSGRVYEYDRVGNLLSSFPIVSSNNVVFLNVVVPEPMSMVSCLGALGAVVFSSIKGTRIGSIGGPPEGGKARGCREGFPLAANPPRDLIVLSSES